MRKKYYLNALGIDLWKPKIQNKFLIILDKPISQVEENNTEKMLLQAILRVLNQNIEDIAITNDNFLIESNPTHILAFNIKNHAAIKNKYIANYIFTYSLEELMHNPLYKKNLYLQLLDLSQEVHNHA